MGYACVRAVRKEKEGRAYREREREREREGWIEKNAKHGVSKRRK